MCGAWLILAAAGMEACGKWRRAGRMAVLAVLAVGLGHGVAEIAEAARTARQEHGGVRSRPRLMANLRRQGGRHLVVVRYAPTHYHVGLADVPEEWVYNDADIDGSPVVWALDMGEEKNRELLDYYKHRQVWLLEPDTDPVVLKPLRTAQP
jgi:hypothetical protein